MLIRALLLVADAELRERLARALEDLEVLVLEGEAVPAWDDLPQAAFDLLLTTTSELPPPPERAIAGIRSLPEGPEVIVLTELTDLDARARLLAAGALSVLSPGLSRSRLRKTLGVLIARHRRTRVGQMIAQREKGTSRLSDFSSRSPAMSALLATAAKVVEADTSLFIVGETGVGKEWLARAIHAEGPRGSGPFVAVNPGSLPETLLESELFGHEKGAFTGASRARRGAFELAHGGTLFLDEIGEMPPHLQVKLLRAVQERAIQRLGSEQLLEIDVRIMSATHQNLAAAVEEKSFRQDLYYRLSVMTLTVPPLRERREDILPLVDTYLDQFRTQLNRLEVAGASREAREALEAYSWPGNVRELINVVERAVLLCDGSEVTLEELPEEISGRAIQSAAGGDAGDRSDWNDRPFAEARERVLEEFERGYLQRLLERSRGRVGEAARRAGIDRRTLYAKMKRLGLSKGEYRTDRPGGSKTG